jgi:hypothetical protein
MAFHIDIKPTALENDEEKIKNMTKKYFKD